VHVFLWMIARKEGCVRAYRESVEPKVTLTIQSNFVRFVRMRFGATRRYFRRASGYAAKSMGGGWTRETHKPDRKCDRDADNKGVEHGLFRVEV